MPPIYFFRKSNRYSEHNIGGMCDVIVIIIGKNLKSIVQILDKAVCFLLRANALEKNMNASLLSSAMCNLYGRLGLVW